MLKKQIIDAVKTGMFHVYQVVTVEDGIEILTSVPAGRPNTDGRYPEGTVYYKVQEK